MRQYKLPVTWTMTGEVQVKANSLEGAIELAVKQPLPQGTYLTDSFEVVEDFIENTEEEPVWSRTDELQWVKQENEDYFVVLETTYFPHNGHYVLQVREINFNCHTEQELEDEVSGYYDGLSDVKSQYGESWKQIVAEIIAENSQIDEQDKTFQSRNELFSHLEKEFGIEPDEGDLIEEEKEEETEEDNTEHNKQDEMILECIHCGHVHTSQENLWTEYQIQCPGCETWEEGCDNRNLMVFRVKSYLR